MKEQAIEKLKSELKGAKCDKYGDVVKEPLCNVLCDFCQQDEEFAQAVVQGGSFENCVKAAVVGAKNHTPDIEIYRKAVQFYFPGCDICMSMSIDLCASVRGGLEPAEPKRGGIVLDLTDFL